MKIKKNGNLNLTDSNVLDVGLMRIFCGFSKPFRYGMLLFCQLLFMSAYSQYNKMLIGDNNHSLIVIANLDGTGFDTINVGKSNQSFYDADVDPVHGKIYLAWYYGIYSMNYDGSGFDTIVNYSAGGYSDGIAVDPVNGYIYWGSKPDKKIYRANLDGTNQVTVLSGLAGITDVDIDVANGRLYYGEWITSKGLYRVDVNGTNNTTIAAGYDVEYLGLDTKNGVIYFSNNSTCRKINYNGTNDNLLFNFQPGGFFVDAAYSQVYITDMTASRVFKCDLLGANVQNLITTKVAAPHGPLLFQSCTIAIITQPGNQNIKAGQNAQFVFNANGTNAVFQWQTDAGVGFQNVSNAGQYSGATNNTLSVSNTTIANNNQKFRCIITSGYCKDTSAIATLNVTNNVGINQISEQKLFSIYPNPASSQLNLDISSNLIGATYSIVDQLGKTLISGKLNSKNSTIELGNLSDGIYMFNFGGNIKQTFNVIKK